MPHLISFLEQLGEKYELPIPAFGHAGDGNIHVNIMLDKGIPKEVENANAAVKDLFGKVIELGGTISGEHGIGLTKAPYMEMEISTPALELMWRLKNAFDPKGILTPGKIFP
jgi:glycolate oxidase